MTARDACCDTVARVNRMKTEIITVGNELISGCIDDTNQTYISKHLASAGIMPMRRSTVGDVASDVVDVLRKAAERSEFVIVTGGLGPTADDITIEAAATAFGLELEVDANIEARIKKFFEKVGIPCAEGALRQARIPRGAEIIRNPAGTAPGVKLTYKNAVFIFLPGVPRELHSMLDTAISSVVSSKKGGAILSRSIKVFGIGESNLEAMLPDRITKAKNPLFSFLPKRFEVELRITAMADSEEKCEALISPVIEEVKTIVGEYVYGEGDDTLETVAFKTLSDKNLTIALAESCTAGMVCGRFASTPGASSVLRGGIVAYSVEIKNKVLGVPIELLEEFGPVSEQCAISMAEKAATLMNTNVGLSVTGNAGPTSGDGKSEVGRFYIALAAPGVIKDTICITRKMSRSRNDIREVASSAALDLIRRTLKTI